MKELKNGCRCEGSRAVHHFRPDVEHDPRPGFAIGRQPYLGAGLAGRFGGVDRRRRWHHGARAGGSLGLSALLAASPLVFGAIRCCGAAYIIYMGVMLMRRGGPVLEDAAPSMLSLPKIFLQSFVTDVLNPKVALFFLAFVPQFIAPDATSKPLSFLLLGVIFDINCMLWFCLLTFGTAIARARINRSGRIVASLKRIAGGAFVFLGMRLALS
jgi:threonine/homoserine/homoserine lactone efflux protein